MKKWKILIIAGIFLLSFAIISIFNRIDCGCVCCTKSTVQIPIPTTFINEKLINPPPKPDPSSCIGVGCSLGKSPLYIDIVILGLIFITSGSIIRSKSMSLTK